MKVLVISDTHGNIANIRHVLGFAKAQKMDAIIHCGDWSTSQDVEEVLKAKLPLYAVVGNADEARFAEIWKALQRAKVQGEVIEFELDGRKIAVGHQPFKVEEQVKSNKFDAVFHGHLHMAAGIKHHDITLVTNPGALGNTTRPSFAVYDTESNEAEIIPVAVF